jgi:hypothetical protein
MGLCSHTDWRRCSYLVVLSDFQSALQGIFQLTLSFARFGNVRRIHQEQLRKALILEI